MSDINNNKMIYIYSIHQKCLRRELKYNGVFHNLLIGLFVFQNNFVKDIRLDKEELQS